ncbi:MAG TPA: TonB-system energizer ExbB [Fibrobacteraceae bacterium]|nr:TonB-system energizer ExbB [Fibrobacteraceae bacterium]
MEGLRILVDYGIIGFLIFMSMVALGVTLERWLFLRRVDVSRYSDKKSLEILVTSRIHLVATIGSNAPYVGLLGTVLGIMLTFYTMGEKGMMNSMEIMTGLALALKATAVGILVAIPSITFYNLLLRKVKVLLMNWDIAHG